MRFNLSSNPSILKSSDVWLQFNMAVAILFQNLWFWDLEAQSEGAGKMPYSLDEGVLRQIKRLLDAIQERRLDLYFCKCINLFEGKDTRKLDEASRKIRIFLKRPNLP